jgi:hypothetical protein
VAVAQAKPPGQGAAVPAPQAAWPSQLPRVSAPPAHEGVPQAVPAAYTWQEAPSSVHSPVFPHEEGAWVGQATWQQTSSKQLPFAHSELAPQGCPSGFLAHTPPGQ